MAIFTYPKISLVVKDYLLSLIQTCISSFAGTNTASGTNSATLNQKSGTLTFSSTVAGSGITSYTLTNSYITTTSLVVLTLNYDTSSYNGRPYIASVTKASGSVVIHVVNSSATVTNHNLVIDFLVS